MLKQIQDEIYEWSVKNFGRRVRLTFNPIQILQSTVMSGKMAHSLLKISQGIRGKKQDLTLIYDGARNGLKDVNSIPVTQMKEVVFESDISSLLGVIEEVGEITYAVLTNNPKEIQDGIADTMVYLLDFCARNGFDSETLLTTVWAKVKERDWKKDPKSGGEVK